MDEKRATEALAAYTDVLIGRPEATRLRLTDEERAQLAPLFQLADRLQRNLKPVQPSAVFVRSLGKELAGKARSQSALAKRMRRRMLIGAAAVGSLVSIASIVGAIVFVVARLRERARAGTAHASTG